jgi:Domain of unknown function (DUF4386)
VDALLAARHSDAFSRWIGGLCAVGLGAAYLVITALYLRGGALPNNAEERLHHLAEHTSTWWWILGLSVATDLLFVPVLWALYAVLKNVNRTMMLAGTSLVALFIVLDLAITWPNYAVLITLSERYAAVAGGDQSTVLGAANYAVEVLSSGLLGVYIILVPALGIFLIGMVMLHSTFGKTAAVTAIATGVLGVVSVAGPLFVDGAGMVAVVASLLTTVWVLLVGFKLLASASRRPGAIGQELNSDAH